MKIQNEFLNKPIFGKFKIIKEEGKGSNSIIFSAQNIINKELVALKIQEKTQNIIDLEKEAYYLFKLKGIGMPKILSYGYSGKYKILVEELLGKSLKELFKENENKSKRIRLKDMLLAGLQIIDRIEFIHSKNILHLDIKPNHFLVGNPNNSLIYLIDFCLAKKYRSSRTGKHVKFSKNSYFSGNLKFSSINTMKGIMPSRRDDLESIGYLLIYLYKQKLPWDKVISKNKIEFTQKIFEIKKLIPLKMLCDDLPKEMIEFMKYVRSLKFEEEPKYEYLIKILATTLEKIDRVNDFNLSWINQSLTRRFPIIQNQITFKIIRKKKKSSFSRIINLSSSLKSKIEEKPKRNKYKIISVIKKNINSYDDEENKNIKSINKNKTSFSNSCSLKKNFKFIRIIKNQIINKSDNRHKRNNNNINFKYKLIKLTKNDNNLTDLNTIDSENSLKYNDFLNMPKIYKTSSNNNINNYSFFKEAINSNKSLNIYPKNSKDINIYFGKKNFTPNNSSKYFDLNNLFLRKKKYYNNIDKNNSFLNHNITYNYICLNKFNDLSNRNNEENNIKLSNDIVYIRKYNKL